MSRLLRFQDKLLLGMALLGDLFEDTRDPGGLVSIAYENVYGFIPRKYKKSNFFSNISRLQKTGDIEKVKVKGKPYLRLTSVGKNNLYKDFPLLTFQNKDWDKKWRIVIFDIEEKNRKRRDNLRKKLRELGFGLIQESVWISPHDFVDDFRDFLEASYLERNVFIMEVKVLRVGNERLLANKIWRLDALNDQYQELYYKVIEKNMDKGKIWQQYCDILFSDPHIPKQLLPVPWYGFMVNKLLTKL